MSKEKRLARKEERAVQKQERNEKFKAVVEQFKKYKDVEISETTNYKDVFKGIWPFFRVSLEFVIVIKVTGEKLDDRLEKILFIGNKIEKSATPDEADLEEFYSKLSKIWDKIDFALDIAKTFTNDEQDKVIDKVLEIGEWILGEKK